MRSVVILSFLVVCAYGSQGWNECMALFPDPNDLPWQPENAVRICREGNIAIAYDVDMITPATSNYHITPDQANNLLPAREPFYEDPDLQAMGVKQASVHSKIFGQQWNRGHCAPNHIMSYSQSGKHSCFTMANIAPQGGYFNQYPWANLEEHVVDWIKNHNALYIITGVSYKDRSEVTRGPDNIAYPDYYWKVLCDVSNGQAVGFYGVNEPETKSTTDFVPVAEIEKMYGGQLFPRKLCKVDTVSPEYWWGTPSTENSSAAVQITSILSLMLIWSVTIIIAL